MIPAKRLWLREVNLEGCPTSGWAYKVSVNDEHLPTKKVPRWMDRIEVPVGERVTIEARTQIQRPEKGT